MGDSYACGTIFKGQDYDVYLASYPDCMEGEKLFSPVTQPGYKIRCLA